MDNEVSELLREFGREGLYSKKESKSMNRDLHKEKLKKDFKQKIRLPENFPKVTFDSRPDGIWETSYIIASLYHNKPLSEFSFTPSLLDYKLLNFLEKNAICITRSTTETSVDANYLFLYKEVFLFLTIGTKEETDDVLLITGLIAYYDIEKGLPYELFDKFKTEPPVERSKIGIIKSGRGGMYVSKISLSHNQTFSFDHYNEDFVTFENNITNQLAEKKPGLFLFHGEPGTGKSSAIRHLVEKVKRNFIFIPPQMISHLSSPEFADIITDTHKGSVLILEDAEKALMKRESDDGFSNSTLVSSILNLTDGLYADLGQLAIIATYNCDRNLIDPALLRKGRLKAEYRFDKLDTDRAKLLAKKLGKNLNIKEPKTLADIFNDEEQYTNNEKSKKEPIGFGFSS